jgi:signal transduction histidine kinase
MIEAIEAFAGWPIAASMAAAMTALGLRSGRRRSALNEAVHELRRPLQVLALSGAHEVSPSATRDSVELAAVALRRLECQINGDKPSIARAEVELQPLLRSAVRRWKARASLAGGSLELRWRAGEAIVDGDRVALAQALDNLIVNAIEPGGPSIFVEVRRRGRSRLRIGVADSGRASRPRSRRESPAETIARLRGGRRHGHGLAVVRRVAAQHAGRFVLRRSERGTVAELELPLLDRACVGAALASDDEQA